MILAATIAGLLAPGLTVPQEASGSAATEQHVIVVVGAAGTSEFGKAFGEWANRWTTAAKKGRAKVTTVGTIERDQADLDALKAAIAATPKTARLWLVLIGHGTYDNRSARFNLKGPDVTATELDDWLDELDVPTAVINCASSSAPFINACSGKDRIVVSATKSGAEQSFARFGDFLSQVIGDSSVDLDKDGQTSLFEAWLIASRRAQDFYSENGRLATEHALLDDNGDERGTRFDAFRGIHAIAKNALDGFVAHRWHLVPSDAERRMPPNLAKQRDEVEQAIKRLRDNRSGMREDEYYSRLEVLLVPLATIYAESDNAEDTEPK